MSKWADYGISAVSFNSTHTHIDRVRVHPDNGETIGSPTEYQRADVVNAIRNGTTFVTIFNADNGKWNKGQLVYPIKINNTLYLKTVDNGKPVDNLDNLPEF